MSDPGADPVTALMHAVKVMNFLKTLILKTLRERQNLVIKSSRASLQELPNDENGDEGPGLNPHVQENNDENEEKEHAFFTDNDHLRYLTATDESDGPRLCNWPVQSSLIEPKTHVVNHDHKPEPLAQSSDPEKNQPLVTDLSCMTPGTKKTEVWR